LFDQASNQHRLQPTSENAKAREANAKLASYKRLRRIEFAALPKTISGKIRRVELRAREAARAAGVATCLEARPLLTSSARDLSCRQEHRSMWPSRILVLVLAAMSLSMAGVRRRPVERVSWDRGEQALLSDLSSPATRAVASAPQPPPPGRPVALLPKILVPPPAARGEARFAVTKRVVGVDIGPKKPYLFVRSGLSPPRTA
jgi:hypothetical protein